MVANPPSIQTLHSCLPVPDSTLSVPVRQLGGRKVDVGGIRPVAPPPRAVGRCQSAGGWCVRALRGGVSCSSLCGAGVGGCPVPVSAALGLGAVLSRSLPRRGRGALSRFLRRCLPPPRWVSAKPAAGLVCASGLALLRPRKGGATTACLCRAGVCARRWCVRCLPRPPPSPLSPAVVGAALSAGRCQQG